MSASSDPTDSRNLRTLAEAASTAQPLPVTVNILPQHRVPGREPIVSFFVQLANQIVSRDTCFNRAYSYNNDRNRRGGGVWCGYIITTRMESNPYGVHFDFSIKNDSYPLTPQVVIRASTFAQNMSAQGIMDSLVHHLTQRVPEAAGKVNLKVDESSGTVQDNCIVIEVKWADAASDPLPTITAIATYFVDRVYAGVF